MSLRVIAELARGVTQLLYPGACLICDSDERESSPLRHGFCTECRAAIVADSDSSCPRCAATLGPHVDASEGCMACRAHSFAFIEAIRLGPYRGKLREAILRIKQPAGEPLAEMLGRTLAEERSASLLGRGIELVTATPLHWRIRWSRRYDQAATIAAELAQTLGVPLARCLRRVKRASQHAQPSAADRRKSIRGAFAPRVSARVAGKTVLLVDDVMTTGATASEAAKTLRSAGAAKVIVAVLARA